MVHRCNTYTVACKFVEVSLGNPRPLHLLYVAIVNVHEPKTFRWRELAYPVPAPLLVYETSVLHSEFGDGEHIVLLIKLASSTTCGYFGFCRIHVCGASAARECCDSVTNISQTTFHEFAFTIPCVAYDFGVYSSITPVIPCPPPRNTLSNPHCP